MEWKKLHFGSAVHLHPKSKVFSGFGLCFIFSSLLFYLFFTSSFNNDDPGTTSLLSWVSSTVFVQDNRPAVIDENDGCGGTAGVASEKTHVENLPEDGVVAGFVSGESENARSSLHGKDGPEGKSNENILSVGEGQAFPVTGDMKKSVKDGRHFGKKMGGDEVVVTERCDIFNGRWVRDRRMPFYTAGSCPYIDRDFDCHNNGRPDSEFLNWRWQPNGCDIPRLNATDFLNRLRGKRLIFVGDSLNRNMWESLVCILRQSVANKEHVFEISGRSEFKTKGFYSFKFKDYNCSIEFVRSPFLVRESYGKGVNGTEGEKLRLDLLDGTAEAYRGADIIIFNTGHWWTHEKTSKGMDYYQEGDHVHPMLQVMQAYEKALTTWAKWVDKNINASKTRVVFRGYSITHFSGGKWNSGGRCHNETEPIFNDSFLAEYPLKMRLLESVLRHMKTPVMYLNISLLTDYRKDGHPSIYRMKYNSVQEQIDAVGSQDCSHWCLPGVPDTWNELLYASLLMDDY